MFVVKFFKNFYNIQYNIKVSFFWYIFDKNLGRVT